MTTTVLVTTPTVSVLRSGIPGTPGVGVPTNAADGQIPVYSDVDGNYVAKTVLSGLERIAVVDDLPDPQITGTLYFVTG